MPSAHKQPPVDHRIGLFGGSFDPVHSGHLHVARSAQEAFELEHVWFVPAARPPHKPGRTLVSGEHRLRMLEIAIADEPTWGVWGIELEREGPSYTFDTVVALSALWESGGRGSEAPSAAAERPVGIYLILGSDNLGGLPGWHRCGELIARVQPVVVMREEADLESLVSVREQLSAAAFERLRRGLLLLPPAPGRATDLRADLAAMTWTDADDRPEEIAPGVWEYIRREGLYRGGS